MSSILVFGASGAVGRFLLPRLAALYPWIAVSRQPAVDERWRQGDLNDPAFPWPAADTVLSLGPLDAFAAAFARTRPAGVRRVLALSSMSADSKRDSPDAAERELAARLVAAEDALKRAAADMGAALTIFRPTLIYGAGSDRSLAPIVRFARRWRVLPVPRGATGLRQPVHADDLAAAVTAALANPATFGRTYALGGGERLTAETLFRRLAEAVPGAVLTLPIPLALLARVAGAQRRAAIARLRVDLTADNAAASADFGYAPRAFDARGVPGPR